MHQPLLAYSHSSLHHIGGGGDGGGGDGGGLGGGAGGGLGGGGVGGGDGGVEGGGVGGVDGGVDGGADGGQYARSICTLGVHPPSVVTVTSPHAEREDADTTGDNSVQNASCARVRSPWTLTASSPLTVDAAVPIFAKTLFSGEAARRSPSTLTMMLPSMEAPSWSRS